MAKNKNKVVLIETRRLYQYEDTSAETKHMTQMENDGWRLFQRQIINGKTVITYVQQ